MIKKHQGEKKQHKILFDFHLHVGHCGDFGDVQLCLEGEFNERERQIEMKMEYGTCCNHCI